MRRRSGPERNGAAPGQPLPPWPVAVAAGPALFREALGRILDSESALEIVATAAVEDDIAATLSRSGARVLLFDYEALGPNGERLIARLRRSCPDCRILVLSSRSGPETVERVLEAGASGLIGKDSALATVIEAIRSVAEGEIWADRRVTARTLERLAAPPSRPSPSDATLTLREAEVSRLVGYGLRNKEVAQRLGIHEKTVKTHMNNIFRKLRIGSRTALAAWAARDA